jgi:hypothetical protein
MFQFTIRDVLWLTVVVALVAVLVVADRENGALAAKNAQLESQKQFLWQHLETAGYDVHNNLNGGSGLSISRKKPSDQTKREGEAVFSFSVGFMR